jgi:hypothetical protein
VYFCDPLRSGRRRYRRGFIALNYGLDAVASGPFQSRLVPRGCISIFGIRPGYVGRYFSYSRALRADQNYGAALAGEHTRRPHRIAGELGLTSARPMEMRAKLTTCATKILPALKLMIWNAAIYSTLVVQDNVMDELW